MSLLSFWRSALFLFSILFFPFSQGFAQEKVSNKMGILLAGQSMEYDFNPIAGITYERGLSRRGSLEFGLFYRTNQQDIYLSIDGPNFSIGEWTRVSEGFVSIPILYRISTRFAQISLGPQVEIFSTWGQRDQGEISLTDYRINPGVTFGPLLKIGKELKFKETLILEPEIRLGIRSFGFGEGFFGLGLRLKKEVHKRN